MAGAGSDEFTVLHVPSNTTDGDTTFIDTSPSNHTITPNGAFAHKTAQSYSGASSYLSAASTSYGTMTDSLTDFVLGDTFFINFQVYFNVATGNQYFIGYGGGYAGWRGTDGHVFTVFKLGTNIFYFQFWNGSAIRSISFSWTPSASQWYNIEISCNNGAFSIDIDTVEKVTSSGVSVSDVTTPLRLAMCSLANLGTTANNFYMDNLIIRKGISTGL